ncbi:MAG: hypothetical protein FJ096_17245 [Deltaproteobacteria bacterium]|nr:hypothetical protein [Deltaproteobacteria bacterium]
MRARLISHLPVLASSWLIGLSLAAACSESSNTGGAGGAGGSGGAASSPAGTGGADVSIATGESASSAGGVGGEGGGTCGAVAFPIEIIQPNMVVLFDRSCSMRRQYLVPTEFAASPTDQTGRWYAARSAVDAVLAEYETRVRFGLMAFPAVQQGCGTAPPLDVAPAIANRMAVLAKLDGLHPFDMCGAPNSVNDTQPKVTPTEDGLVSLDTTGAVADPMRPDFVLLVTDGGATCGSTPQSLATRAATLLGKGAKTAVVGFGDVSEPQATDMLEALGKAGGLPKPGGPPSFWLANAPNDLKAAIDAIVADALSCTFQLKDVPPDGDKLYASFDGMSVPKDTADGFTYDAGKNTVTFKGTACKALQEGTVKNVSVVYGCPDNSCQPSEEICDGLDNDCDGEVDDGTCIQ